MSGKVPEDKLLAEAAYLAMREAQPISDRRATAEYRREMTRVWTERALREAFRRT